MITVEDPLLEDSLSNGDKEQIVRRHRIISTALIGAACVAVVGAAASGSTVRDIAGGAVSAQDFGAGDASVRSVHPDFEFSDLYQRYSPEDVTIMNKEELAESIEMLKSAFESEDGGDPLAQAMGFFFMDMDMSISPSSCEEFLPNVYVPLASVTDIPEEAAMVSQYFDGEDYGSEYSVGKRTVVVQVIRGGDLESMDVNELRNIMSDCARMEIDVSAKAFGETITSNSAIGINEIPFDIGAEDQVAFAVKQAITSDDDIPTWQYLYIAFARVGDYRFIVTVDIPVSDEQYQEMDEYTVVRELDEYAAIHQLDAVIELMETPPESPM